MKEICIFISYSHDSDEHRNRVIALAQRLRTDGMPVITDADVARGSPPEGWPRWMTNSIERATHVLSICTETYAARFRGNVRHGKGANWEGAHITQAIYDDFGYNERFVPIIFTQEDKAHIPSPLNTAGHYCLDDAGGRDYKNLVAALHDRAGVVPEPIGVGQIPERRRVAPIHFSDENVAQPIEETATRFDVSRILEYAPESLVGREGETDLLDRAWKTAVDGGSAHLHIVAVVAAGGEGKTSLVATWLIDLLRDAVARGCRRTFAWSFYNQGTRGDTSPSSDLFLSEALTFFGDAEMATSGKSAYEKARRLAQLAKQPGTLLILDGLEPLQHSPTSSGDGALRDGAMSALLRDLALHSNSLCVVTTRYPVREFRPFVGKSVYELVLLRLSKLAGRELLRKLGVTGDPSELDQLTEDLKGHALTLTLFGSYLRRAHAGDVRKRSQVNLEDADAETQGGHAFRVMDSYVRWFESGEGTVSERQLGRRALSVLTLIGLFDRPASADCIGALLAPPAIPGLTDDLAMLTEAQRNSVYALLDEAKLVTVNRSDSTALVSIDSHPVIRAYFGRMLQKRPDNAWTQGHLRLFEYLSRYETDDTPSFDDLQPLYHAVSHGCKAGIYQASLALYYNGILRGTQFYSLSSLGAHSSDIRALENFFTTPWNAVNDQLSERHQNWILGLVSGLLSALGRTGEALPMLIRALDSGVVAENWKNVTIRALNLCVLYTTLGDLLAAIQAGEQSVTYRDNHNEFIEDGDGALIDALFQAGRYDDAARAIHRIRAYFKSFGNEYFHLGDGYDLGELQQNAMAKSVWTNGETTPLSALRSQLLRLDDSGKFYTSDVAGESLFVQAMNHLIRGKLVFLRAIAAVHSQPLRQLRRHGTTLVVPTAMADFPIARALVDRAVAGLRQSAQRDDLPRGLLARAWLRAVAGELSGIDSAQEDLDEIWDIASLGSMRLFMADVHLWRARFFGDQAEAGIYPWQSPAHDVAEARRLIEACGYWRRREELAFVESRFSVPPPPDTPRRPTRRR